MIKVSIGAGRKRAKKAAARGNVIILVDTLRATSTITCALVCGAKCVIPVKTLSKARSSLGKRNTIVCGERGGRKIENLDLGNSPTEMLKNKNLISGKRLVLTTSNATDCLSSIGNNNGTILAGSSLNVSAVAHAACHYAKKTERDIFILCAGRKGKNTEEDRITAALIKKEIAKIMNSGVYSAKPKKKLRLLKTVSGKRLTRLGYKEDVKLCSTVNSIPSVAKFKRGRFILDPKHS